MAEGAAEADGDATSMAGDVGFVAVAARPEAVRLAEAVRRLAAAAVVTPASDDDLAAGADQLEALATRLEAGAARSRFDGLPTDADGRQPFPLSTHPLLGDANPLAPPVEVEAVDGVVHGRARYSPAYEGLAGRLHGGYVAAAFDVVLGFAAALTGHAAVTGTLTVKYVRPIPLEADLLYVADPGRVEGRKLLVQGRLLADGEVVSEAEAVFIAVDRGRYTSAD